MMARDTKVQSALLEPATSVFSATRYFGSVPEAYRKKLEAYSCKMEKKSIRAVKETVEQD